MELFCVLVLLVLFLGLAILLGVCCLGVCCKDAEETENRLHGTTNTLKGQNDALTKKLAETEKAWDWFADQRDKECTRANLAEYRLAELKASVRAALDQFSDKE